MHFFASTTASRCLASILIALAVFAQALQYTVQPGDSFYEIALHFNVTLAALEAANPQITNPASIFPGEVINIPTGEPPKTYVVVAGDTLTNIAAKFGVSLACLEKANPQIPNPDVLTIGEVINIPSVTSTDYTVLPGDFLYAIAQKFGITLAALEAANPQLSPPWNLTPGQVIHIPGGGC